MNELHFIQSSKSFRIVAVVRSHLCKIGIHWYNGFKLADGDCYCFWCGKRKLPVKLNNGEIWDYDNNGVLKKVK